MAQRQAALGQKQGDAVTKNILILSDGTGQVGGIAFDEDRTNIYKLYRATRTGPDSCINPAEQVAFYDPGIGSAAERGFRFGRIGRRFYNLASQATGLGLTANIIDCYAGLIRLYEDGDRIFLFGFSRGSYTVRSLAGVIAKCGIPRHLPNGQPVPLDRKGSHRVASEAVKEVYQYCASKPRTEGPSRTNFLLDTRELIAARFRAEHGSADPADSGKANVYPYFIGVFDTVAALARPALLAIFAVCLGVILAVASLVLSTFILPQIFAVSLAWWQVFGVVLLLTLSLSLLLAAPTYLKYDFRVPDYGFWKSLRTIHLAEAKNKFYDLHLNENIRYAKHALAIDENRKDFARVRWFPPGEWGPERDQEQNIRFEQVWFTGNHADIGGGYPEVESRLSDITLNWMLAAASVVPNGIKHDERVLHLYPDPTGIQHDELKKGHWQRGRRDLRNNATMHKSVYRRFEAGEVVQYDVRAPYQPENLFQHMDFGRYYRKSEDRSTSPPRCTADDIEFRWQKKLRSARAHSEAASA